MGCLPRWEFPCGKEDLLNGGIVLDEEAFDVVLDEFETILQKCAAEVRSDGVSPDEHLVTRERLTDVGVVTGTAIRAAFAAGDVATLRITHVSHRPGEGPF
ncbi:MAG: hypothetical protein WBX22_26585 [Silvibacterium sp.]